MACVGVKRGASSPFLWLSLMQTEPSIRPSSFVVETARASGEGVGRVHSFVELSTRRASFFLFCGYRRVVVRGGTGAVCVAPGASWTHGGQESRPDQRLRGAYICRLHQSQGTQEALQRKGRREREAARVLYDRLAEGHARLVDIGSVLQLKRARKLVSSSKERAKRRRERETKTRRRVADSIGSQARFGCCLPLLSVDDSITNQGQHNRCNCRSAGSWDEARKGRKAGAHRRRLSFAPRLRSPAAERTQPADSRRLCVGCNLHRGRAC